ncbi:MAG: permease prefix domain 2-containing transporter, partial [Bacteroidota bacterium]
MNKTPTPSPPKWAERFLQWFCADDLWEEVSGDIEEMYLRNLKEKGGKKAQRRFVLDVITFINYSTIRGRKPFDWNPIPTIMFKSYLVSAIRSLIFQKEYTIINILGLALGLACLILISIYGKEELGFDMFHAKADKIYRVIERVEVPNQDTRYFAGIGDPVGNSLVNDFPQFNVSTSMLQWGQAVMYVGDSTNLQQFNERNYLIADENFLNIFDFTLLKGDQKTCLSEPGQIVLTESTAKKYFGQEDPMGKRVSFNRSGELLVTAVLEDPPTNSHIQFDFLASIHTFLRNDQFRSVYNEWGNNRLFRYNYLVSDAPLDEAIFQASMEAFEAKHRSEPGRSYQLQALKDIHFGSENLEFDLLSSINTRRSKTYLTLFAWLALIVLLVAGINYVNLATARSMRRSKEIGIRKVIGAQKGQIMFQFLIESILTAFVGLLLAVAMTYVVLRPFNEVTRKAFEWSMIFEWDILLFVLGGTILIGLLAGIFPAFVLANLKILRILKGKLASISQGRNLRRGLVVTQFVGTLAILVGTIVVYQQMRYIQQKDLGFEEEKLLVIDINSGTASINFVVFKDELQKHPDISTVSSTSRVPGECKNINEATVMPQGNRSDSLESLFFCFDE